MTDTRALYAVHGENDLDYDGYVARTFGIGHDPAHHGGEDMRGPHTMIARINEGYHPNGSALRSSRRRSAPRSAW